MDRGIIKQTAVFHPPFSVVAILQTCNRVCIWQGSSVQAGLKRAIGIERDARVGERIGSAANNVHKAPLAHQLWRDGLIIIALRCETH